MDRTNRYSKHKPWRMTVLAALTAFSILIAPIAPLIPAMQSGAPPAQAAQDGWRPFGWMQDAWASQGAATLFNRLFAAQPAAAQATAPGGVAPSFWSKADEAVYVDNGTTPANDGEAVQQWNDVSGGNFHVVQTNAALQPTFVSTSTFNFNPSLAFGYAQDSLQHTTGADVIDRADGTIYVVGAAKSASTTYHLAGFDASADYPGLYLYSGGQSWLYSGGAYISDNSITANQPFIAAGSWVNQGGSNPAYGRMQARLDGAAKAYDNTVNVNTSSVLNELIIGDDSNWNGIDGNLAEVIIFEGELTAAEMQRVDSYLALKYGITLLPTDDEASIEDGDYVASDGTTVIWDHSANAAYHNDVAGIGRDDDSGLDQQKSKSVNAGALVTIDHGGAFSSDLNFLVWGNNGQAASYGTAYTPGSFTPSTGYVHMNRIWMVQETGPIGNVTVSGPAEAEHLLVDDDGDFSNGGTTEYALSGGSVTVDLSDGEFFTFGRSQIAPGGVMTGLAHWVRADMGAFSDAGSTPATDGQSVQLWDDQSGTNLDLGQSTATQQPTYRAGSERDNFNPSIDFTDDFMFNDGRLVQTTDDLTMIAVGDTDVVNGVRTLYASGDNMNDPTMDLDVNRISPWFDWGGTVDEFANELVSEQPMIWGIGGENGVANGMFAMYQGEVRDINMTVTDQPNYGNRVGVGSDGGGEDWDGRILEAFTYNRSLPGDELQQVNTYLAIKYGITLRTVDYDATIVEGDYVDSTGSKVWDYTANAAYHNNVAGIGRDDASGLDQRKSKSVHDGALVTIDSGGAFTDDGTFLMWGHNGQAASYGTTYAPGSFTPPAGYFHMDRIWKVAKTGTITDVIVTAPAGAEHLLVDDDGDFSNGGTTEHALSGGTATVTLADGEFFTFGRGQTAPGGVMTALSFWSKADEAGCSPGDNCTDWDDLSSNGNPIETIGTMTLQAADADHNFHPFFSGFSAANYFKDDDSSFAAPYPPIDATEISVFSVARANSLTNDGRITGMDNDNNYAAEPGLSILDGSPNFYRFSTSTENVTLADDVAVDTSALFSARTSGTELILGLDGSYTTEPIVAGGGFAGDIFNIGYGIWSVNGPFPGDIQEVIWYRTDVSDAERLRIESYLALKYGITLTDTQGISYTNSLSQTVWDADANAAYHNDVAGIGLDAVSALQQKQSKSVNSDAIVTMGLGAIAEDNASNANAFAVDGSFLVWGNDDGTVAFGGAVSGVAESTDRLQRVWKAQETGTVGTVEVMFDDPVVQSGEGYCLLVDDDGDFTNGGTTVADCAAANSPVTFSHDFTPAAPFFTLGTTQPDVLIAKSVNPSGSVDTDDPIVYTLTIANTGVVTATNVVVTDTIPAGLTGLSASNSFGAADPALTAGATASWNIGDVGPSMGGTIIISATAPASGGVITNTAGITATNDISVANNSASVVINVIVGDADGDGVPDSVEDIDGDGDPDNDDTDSDGTPDYLDTDDDGDGIPTASEDVDGDGDPTNDDTDSDGTPDYLDDDDDGDGIPTASEDVDGDGDPTNDDTDSDGTPDYLDDDDDGDGTPTASEDPDGDGNPANDDTDGDGTPDYLDDDNTDGPLGDADGDGVVNQDEDVDGDGDWTNDDTDSDGTPDYQDTDDDGDGIPTLDEDVDGDGDPTNDDTDSDGTPDYLDDDDDGDGTPTASEDPDGDGNPANDDTDGDGTPDYLDDDNTDGPLGDADGDGVVNQDEDVDGDGNWTNDDTDSDGTPDYQDTDDDGDGIPTLDEDVDGDGDPTNDDTDSDGTPDYLDDDDDGDGIPTLDEDVDGDGDPSNDDTDSDGTPDYLDDDDDGDGTPTASEDPDGDGNPANDDTDGDGTPDYLDDDDTDGPLGDADGDGVVNQDEDVDGDGNWTNDDTDSDGTPDYQDTDDDGDGIPTLDEDVDGDGDPTNDDTDSDGTPDYLDDDDDGDGASTADENNAGSDPLDPNSTPDDRDGDGVSNDDETNILGTDPDDADSDSSNTTPDENDNGTSDADEDFDGDGFSNAEELDAGSDPLDPNSTPQDSDGDGVSDADETNILGTDPNDPDSDSSNTTPDENDNGVSDADEDFDGDGFSNKEEIDAGSDPLDGDSTPDDRDGDGVSNDDETNILGTDPDDADSDSSNTTPDEDDNGTSDADEDLDGDGFSNAEELDAGSDPLDPNSTPQDSDGDGVLDTEECPNGEPCPDTDGDGTPDYLDTDDDNDGVSTRDEGPDFRDIDGDGIPNYLDADEDLADSGDSDGDGVLDRLECFGGTPCPDIDGDGVPAYMDPDERYNPFDNGYYLPVIRKVSQ